MAGMYQRSADKMRAVRGEIKSKELVAKADAVIKAWENEAKDAAARKPGGPPQPNGLREAYFKAEQDVANTCGPVFPRPSNGQTP